MSSSTAHSSLMCSSCGQVFTRPDNKLRHESECQSERRFPCIICGKDFGRKDSLTRHLKTCKPNDDIDTLCLLVCGKCGSSFSRVDARKRHENACCMEPNEQELTTASVLLCGKCGVPFTDLQNRLRHELTCLASFSQPCSICDHIFTNKHNLMRHEETCGQPPVKKRMAEPTTSALLALQPDMEGLNFYETAFEGRLRSYFIRSEECYDLPTFLRSISDKIEAQTLLALEEHGAVKINLVADCFFKNTIGETCQRSFKTKNKAAFMETDLHHFLDNEFNKLTREMEESELKNSGWTLEAVDGLRLRINKYKPLRGCSYVPLPDIIENRKACINIINNDVYCFKYCMMAKFVNDKSHRVASYQNITTRYNFDCVNYPVQLNDVKKFENNNSVSINVFGIDKNAIIYPLKVVKEELEDHRDLLLLENPNGHPHYVYIKNFERLVKSQITKHKESIAICKRCFTHFDNQYGKSKEEKLEDHRRLCIENKPVLVNMPIEKPYVKFVNVEKCMRVPFVVYCDFECCLKPIDSCNPDPMNSYTKAYQEHHTIAACCYLKCSDDMIGLHPSLPTEPFVYQGEDAAKKILEHLTSLAEEISKIYSSKKPMDNLTAEEVKAYRTATTCYMCDKSFQPDQIKVRDHCHITGKYRGPAHRDCNIRYRNPDFLPIVFHNLSGYDSHFIIRELGSCQKRIDIIPSTEEKFISFTIHVNAKLKLRFIDSLRFMAASLDKLSKGVKNFRELKKFFPEDQMQLLTRKGVFPYDYITSIDKLEETSLPSKNHFYNQLNQSDISDEDYKHANSVWKIFKIKNLGEYCRLYMETDVLLLADIFETFRDVTIKTHKLDPAHYFTLPGLTWDAMLRFTGIKLELLTDYEQLLMIESGIRGGVCQVSHRYIEANNKYMENYDTNKESIFINYVDCNNLYGYAMSQVLPYGGFKWIQPTSFKIEEMCSQTDRGYILDVDIDYPEYLHDDHDELPFLCENIIVNKQKKLVPHLNNRKNYVVHYIALKQALDHGLKLVKINRVLQFNQSAWLKPYIDHNTSLRTQATTDFEKDVYKLYNNAVYGKTMENIRKHLNMKLINTSKKIEKIVAKPEFIDRTIYNENLAAVHLSKKSILFNKPIYLGLSILDLSKLKMYEYHYDVMKKIYPARRLKLAYMDTDSFIYKILTEDLYTDLFDILHHLDTSDYPPNHPLYSTTNKKIVGKFKDEAMSEIITRFVGLRAKMYCLDIGNRCIKKVKGVQSCAVKNCITIENFIECLFNNLDLRLNVRQFRSDSHIVKSIEINKLALSPHDDKRIIMEDGVNTRAIGFKGIG